MVDVGFPGRQSDGGVFRKSKLGKMFQRNSIDLPKPKRICIGGPVLPYHLVGDEAFGLKKYMQRPYPGRTSGTLDLGKQVFNYRLSRARRVIENSFGILAAKWRVFRQPIQANNQKVKQITLAAVCLHNFILMEEENLKPHQRTYLHPSLVDREVDGVFVNGDWRNDLVPIHPNTFANIETNENEIGSQAPIAIRDELNEFFMTSGFVKWQFTQNIY